MRVHRAVVETAAAAHAGSAVTAASPDVLIVGAGPAGVVAALLLGDLGVSTLLVDRRTDVSTLPRARGIHARACEILRQLGVEDDMVAHQLAVRPRMEVRTSLGLDPVMVADTGGATFAEVSPCEGIAIAQDDFESVLRTHLARRASVTFRTGLRLTSLAMPTVVDGGHATATLTDISTGESTAYRPRFVIGADGWRSDTRGFAGIAVLGDGDLGAMRSVRFRADLSTWLGDPPPAFIRLAATDGVLLPTHADHRWVTMRPAGSGTPQDAVTFVRDQLGVDAAPEVLGDDTWTAAVQYAERFSRGPVFLIGDAAHRVTPAGATGISSAMADAHNLAWKISGVLAGWAGPGVLETYAAEREPVAHEICALNRRMWDDLAAHRVSAPMDLRVLDMGYTYASPIVLPPPAHVPLDQQSEYRPSAVPGARAPHAWIVDAGRRMSTIDLFGRGFVLLTDPAGTAWVEAAEAEGPSSGPPRVGVVVRDGGLGPAYDLAHGEAILVRPDGHVAWRSGAAPAEFGPVSAAATLSQVMRAMSAPSRSADST